MELDFDKFKRSLIISKNDKYAFLLGAGSSITSGIQSAYDCIWEWKKMIYQTSNNISSELIENFRNKKNQEIIQNWLDNQGRFPPNGSEIEYSFYANECFPIDEDRRKYFQKICSNAQPSIGYKATALLAKSGFVDTIWTTNFDDLMRDACISQRFQSIDITLENTSRIINRAQNSSELPILKLHGDFKFGDLKNTESELKTQDEVFREKMIEYLKDKHLIVFGYSGRDHSLMNTLRELYSKDGGGRLYWCGYKENKSEVVKDLILSANERKTRAFYIATEGFDNAIYQIAQLLLSDNVQIYNEFEVLVKDDSKKIESIPFNLMPKKTNTVLKSNFFPIEFPKEVYVFEHTITGKTWDFLNENILPEKGIAAVPIGNQIWSLGVAENISKLFGSFIQTKLVRKPITEITNSSNNLIYLFLSAICKYYSLENKLNTDNNRKLWSENDFKFIKGHKVYSAIRLNIEIISNQVYITLNPDFHVDSKDEIHTIGLEYFHQIWNSKFNEYVSKWREILFKNFNEFDFPNNSNSGFAFKIKKNPVFTLIDDLTKNNNETHNIPSHLIRYRGVKFREPNLIFSSNNGGKRCLESHPMKGLVNHKPYETGIDHFLNKQIKMSVLCISEYSQKLNNFLSKLNTKIPVNNPKESYLIDYEGFYDIYNVDLEIPNINSSDWREIEDLALSSDIKNISNRIKENICSEILKISASRTQKVIVIFIPDKWLKYTSFSNEYESFNLHDYIKAFCAEKGLTSQFITERTLLDKKQECQVIWWLSLSFYVKSFRTPWLVENSTSDTAFAGIGYSVDKFNKNNPIILGCSHLYTSNGEGLKYKLSKLSNDKIQWRDKKPHLSYDDAYDFGRSIINLFYESMNEMPRRVVIHKRTFFTKEERDGICDSLLENANIQNVDLIEINFEDDVKYVSSKIKNGKTEIDGYSIARGTCIQLTSYSALLWTHGIIPSVKNEYYNFYPGGRYIPKPLKIIRHYGNSSLEQISNEILGLSKMNWNSLNMYSQLPATIFSSNEIARIGKLVNNMGSTEYDYRFFI